ncbi:hypothetical protein MTR67_036015 [Solanum verrucosum]|uniref:Uncharacterized protein n=1 Tax=Solanum verrucosum TaxID=315347 RepID=A0AAF0UB82_SOLVR|nr:hypothetical protein MTR67_036015 [Solanum verrucosum]
MQGDFISTPQNISDEAVNVFREQFRETQEVTDYSMLQFIPKIITGEHNLEMERVPPKDEIKHVVFGQNGDSASRHDGYSGFFFQSCWDITGDDVWNMVRAFYNGYELSRTWALYYTKGDNVIEEELEVRQFVEEGEWNEQKLGEKLSTEMVKYIVGNTKPPDVDQQTDVPWWMGNTQGAFTVKPAWELMRRRQEKGEGNHNTCFLTAFIAKKLWRHFDVVAEEENKKELITLGLLEWNKSRVTAEIPKYRKKASKIVNPRHIQQPR